MANPSTSNFDPSSWGFVQWTITTIVGVATAVFGYILRINTHLATHSEQLNQNKDDIAELSKELGDITTLIENRFDQLNSRLERLDFRIDASLRGH